MRAFILPAREWYCLEGQVKRVSGRDSPCQAGMEKAGFTPPCFVF